MLLKTHLSLLFMTDPHVQGKATTIFCQTCTSGFHSVSPALWIVVASTNTPDLHPGWQGLCLKGRGMLSLRCDWNIYWSVWLRAPSPAPAQGRLAKLFLKLQTQKTCRDEDNLETPAQLSGGALVPLAMLALIQCVTRPQQTRPSLFHLHQCLCSSGMENGFHHWLPPSVTEASCPAGWGLVESRAPVPPPSQFHNTRWLWTRTSCLSSQENGGTISKLLKVDCSGFPGAAAPAPLTCSSQQTVG